ncbi:MAG TPA: hypothetical protein VG826_16960, partial [Pirellulales bacterium]|nr:hypothetical protein [Pirellulales bacterium]
MIDHDGMEGHQSVTLSLIVFGVAQRRASRNAFDDGWRFDPKTRRFIPPSQGNRSQPGEQRRDVLASEMSGDGLGDEVQGATVLLAAGFNGGKHRFH